MTTLGGTLDTLRAAQASLGSALREHRWTDALTACNDVSSTLVSLHAHLDGMTDDSRHAYVTDAYNAAVEQHNAAIDAIADAGELPGWRIGDVQACGARTTRRETDVASRMTLAEVADSIDSEGGDLWKWVGYIRLDPARVPKEIAPLIAEANDMVDRLHAVLGRIAETCGYEIEEG